jgi:acyl-CoA thioester hydrolase
MNDLHLEHKHDIRVRYADTDQMQIVWNGKYFEYFEVGRTELLRSLGLRYSELEHSGTRLPVVDTGCKYYIPARYDDLITIETRMDATPTARLRIDYRILNSETGNLLAEGYTVHAFQNIASLKPVRPPKIFLDAVNGSISQS